MTREPAQQRPGLIAHHVTAPRRQERLPESVPARCTARSYEGTTVTVEGVVEYRAEGGRLLAFTADYPGGRPWTAWVARECCEALGR
ncbi:hypothetical protein GCM10009809_08290 [Isoptericola hypogeus]|uniref:Uncharacterized protein n=1 Tax=Isoptericola hypogeus TaxID=300179 RepID=A0ABP4V1L3_9MICO